LKTDLELGMSQFSVAQLESMELHLPETQDNAAIYSTRPNSFSSRISGAK
jgi:hypothetical protein